MKGKTAKDFKENIEGSPHDLGVAKIYSTEQKIIPTKSEAILVNQDCSSKDTIGRVKIQSTELKEKFAIDIFDKVLEHTKNSCRSIRKVQMTQ